jgi:hypothetical protein
MNSLCWIYAFARCVEEFEFLSYVEVIIFGLRSIFDLWNALELLDCPFWRCFVKLCWVLWDFRREFFGIHGFETITSREMRTQIEFMRELSNSKVLVKINSRSWLILIRSFDLIGLRFSSFNIGRKRSLIERDRITRNFVQALRSIFDIWRFQINLSI